MVLSCILTVTVYFDDDITKIDVLCLHCSSAICTKTPRSARPRGSLRSPFGDFAVSEVEVGLKKGGKMRRLEQRLHNAMIETFVNRNIHQRLRNRCASHTHRIITPH